MKAHELNLQSIAFAELRVKLDEEIQSIVTMLEEKGLSEGVITAKIKVGMMTGTTNDGEIVHTVIFEPKISSRIGSSFEDKLSATGGRVTVQEDGTVIPGQVTMDEIMDDKKGA